MQRALDRLKSFFTREIWEIESAELSPVARFALRQLQVATVVVRDFFADHCMVRASSLSFTSLLAIVPLLALMFSLLKGLGGLESTLEPFILEQLSLGSEEIGNAIIVYIKNTSLGKLGAYGLVALIGTVIALLSNIEESFNYVWGVKETRPLFRIFADYSSVVVVGPVFVAAAVSMSTSLKSQSLVQAMLEMAVVGPLLIFLFQVLPFLVMWAAFTFLYIFIPNIKVDMRAAIIGGIFGGTLWILAQGVYVDLQIGVAKYNAIYGTMAALPIFMVWIHVSWVIVFLGLELTYACQNLRVIRRELRGDEVNFASRELVALSVLLVTARIFLAGEKPWNMEQISERLEIPPRLARSVLSDLVRVELLVEVLDGEGHDLAYQPACVPENLQIASVLQLLKEDGVNFTKRRKVPEFQLVVEIEEQLKEVGRKTLDGLSLQDLVRRLPAGGEEGEGTTDQ